MLASVIEYCLTTGVVSRDGDRLTTGRDDKLQSFLRWTTWPALTTLLVCAEIMREVDR